MKNKLMLLVVSVSVCFILVGWGFPSKEIPPKTFKDGQYTEVKTKWNSGGFDYQVIMTAPTNLPKDAVWLPDTTPLSGITIRFLDKDGFEVLNNRDIDTFPNSNSTIEENGKKKIYRGSLPCAEKDYEKICSVKVEHN